jgi:ferrous iron transport protein B
MLRVALVGNPNTGKSTLFQALSGVRQHTGNYPGVTVEKKVGQFSVRDQRIELIDLPGTYSLAPRSPDEMVSVHLLLGLLPAAAPPDVIVCIVDASNLTRNMFLVSQVLELGKPVILALNMCDLARSRGIKIDQDRLSQKLGIPVVAIEAHRKVGLEQLRQTIADAACLTVPKSISVFSGEFEGKAEELAQELSSSGKACPPFLCRRLLLDSSGFLEAALKLAEVPRRLERLKEKRLAIQNGRGSLAALESIARYQWIGSTLSDVVTSSGTKGVRWTDRIDRIATHRVWGVFLLAFVLVFLFQSIFTWSQPLMDGIEQGIAYGGELASRVLPEGPFRSLVVDGVIAGVGGVLVFLPQILMLFLFIGLLEDCGYMARAAFLMDRIMAGIGLSGRSFIPLLSSFACAVPGIMAARVIENRRDRLMTILLAPLMSCSARLPVYTLFINAFIPARRFAGGWIDLRGLVMCVCYLIGIVAAIFVGFFLRRWFFAGERPTFLMELPSYKLPTLSVVAGRLWDRGWSFVHRAGTLILAVSILVWGAAYYPRDPDVATKIEARHGGSRGELVEAEIRGAYLRQSWLGRLGHWIEPAVRPLGWDWRIGCAVLASFPAREVVIGNLGVIYNLAENPTGETSQLEDKLKGAIDDRTGKPIYTIPVALSLLVFFALCAQCAATLVVIRRETNSWRWPIFTFTYMTGLAYLAAFVTYQGAQIWSLSS